MRIAVCFKIVPDFEDVIPGDWDDLEHMDFSYVKKIYGCYDEAALETALRLKDGLEAAGEPVRCVAVTVGRGPAVLLSGLYAAGFQEVVCIEGAATAFSPGETERRLTAFSPGETARRLTAFSPGEAERQLTAFSPGETARQLSAFWQEERPDVIFTGQSVGACDSGFVPALMAAHLGCQWLGPVTDVYYNNEENKTVAVCEDERFFREAALTFPMVLSVGNAAAASLRMFSLKARMEAKKKTVILWRRPEINAPAGGGHGGAVAAGANDLGVDYCLLGLSVEKKANDCQMIAGDDEQVKAERLLELMREVARL